MPQHNLPSFQTKADRTTYLVFCRAFTLPPSGVVLNYPCQEHTANLCHVLSISGMRGLQEKKKKRRKEKKKREKRQLWEAWKSSLFICSAYFPFSTFTYTFSLNLLFNILSKSGTTEVACKSFLYLYH